MTPAAELARADLRQLYTAQLSARGFTSDEAQLAVLTRLEALRARVLAAAAQPGVALPRWLGTLLGRAPREPVRGLYLWGSVGRGKTWLMDLFCASLPRPLVRRRHFHRFMHEVHQHLGRLQHQLAPLEHVARIIARDTRVLCFDELYVTDIGDAMILGGLFAALFRRGVTLVATSNLAPQELYKDGLQRQRFLPAIALLERHLEVVRLGGSTDYRLRQLTAAGTYLRSDAPGAEKRLAALFTQLSEHDAAAGGSIEIAGRAIPVVRVGAGVAWFSFAALCAGARSTEDYIEIAREYQSVILAEVPVLDGAHEDEARRFIALIDELYDRNVKLIVSAAAAPAELYRGERLGALFARTASRLTEMQSAEYLAREHRA
ncbi:MAG: AFG1 family ATPase [Sinobacteraceae bacterium]|nr:AFG1 family ATPase [Nevskiaceae bacterium]